MLAWKWGPALAAGNTIVMKTSEKTPLTALYVCRLAAEAGFPAGVINVLSGFGPTAGNAVSSHMDIRKVAFTGSTRAGKQVMAAAASSNLKKVSLELGGKSPSIVFADADLDRAVRSTSMGIFFNHGQCCCAGSRVFVHEDIYDEFVRRFREHARDIRVGDQLDDSTDHGPLVDGIQFHRVMGYIEKGKDEGATVEIGGERVGAEGYFVPPTVFSSVDDEMTIAQEEIFGPVACLLKFKTEDEVVKRANATEYGLAASVHTNDVKLASRMAARLEAGTVWINWLVIPRDKDNFGLGVRPFSSNTKVPFGGFKQSGSGRELGEEGLYEYTEVKSVIMVSCA
ncbi:MAG: mitochondrial Aldh2 [Olpidium bornovanus]|uniref:aldehyde dehydrogenase (NAD(+)) n=1 Tax=Olpidium bornovanus TaxID=278681 RepID=A0A8H7ZS87_9FUNG|nr:MAG: mitochondrial Aldh2 [Olpidium bornovanus]